MSFTSKGRAFEVTVIQSNSIGSFFFAWHALLGYAIWCAGVNLGKTQDTQWSRNEPRMPVLFLFADLFPEIFHSVFGYAREDQVLRKISLSFLTITL